MPKQTKVFRVFISSTFSDMQEERSLLQEKVFPRLESYCAANDAKFQAVDLRWGVGEDAVLNQETLGICLHEVERCQRLSPKPNFLILLGDKYGWQPVTEVIPASEWDLIYESSNIESKQLLSQWYIRDDNAIPVEYRLRQRDGEYQDDRKWALIEHNLRQLFMDYVPGLCFKPVQNLKYFGSATHQEIDRGILNPVVDLPNPEKYVVAFERNIQKLPESTDAKDFIDLRNSKADSDSRQKLENLKTELKEKLGVDKNYFHYQAEWKGNKSRLTDAEGFSEIVFIQLFKIIEEQIQLVVEENALHREISFHEEFKSHLTKDFRGRKGILQNIANLLKDTENHSIISLIGESGSGKSSIMAKCIEAYCKTDNAAVIFRFLGITTEASSEILLTTSLCEQIAEFYNQDIQTLVDQEDDRAQFSINGLADRFKKCLNLASSDRPLIIFLDALDQNPEICSIIFRDDINDNVKIVVSGTPDINSYLPESHRIQVTKLGIDEGEAILSRWLEMSGRTLTEEQERYLLSKFSQSGLPIYLKILFEMAVKWSSYTVLPDLPDDLSELIFKYFQVLEERHSVKLVTDSIGFMLSSKDSGITEKEILDLLVVDKTEKTGFWQHFIEHSHPDHRTELEERGILPIVVWSRLYLDLEPYLSEQDSNGEMIFRFYHDSFNHILHKKYINNTLYYFEKISDYYSSIWNKKGKRALDGLPRSLRKAKRLKELIAILQDDVFIQEKCSAGLMNSILKDYDRAVVDLHLEESVHRIPGELDAYFKLIKNGVSNKGQKSKIPDTIIPFQKKPDKVNLDHFSLPIEKLVAFKQILESQSAFFRTYSAVSPVIWLQQLYNTVDEQSMKNYVFEKLEKSCGTAILKTYNKGTDQSSHIQTFEEHLDVVWRIDITPDAQRIVSCSDDQSLKVWDMATGSCVKTILINEKLRSVKISPDGSSAVVSGKSGTIYLYNLVTGRKLKWFDCSGEVIGYRPHDAKLFFRSNLNIGQPFCLDMKTEDIIEYNIPGNNHPYKLDEVEFAPLTDLAYICLNVMPYFSDRYDCQLVIYDLKKNEVIQRLSFSKAIKDVSITPWGEKGLLCFEDSVELWDFEAYTRIKTLTLDRWVSKCAITPNAQIGAAAGMDLNPNVYALNFTDDSVTIIGKHDGQVNDVKVFPDGKKILTCSVDKTIKVWDIRYSIPETERTNAAEKILAVGQNKSSRNYYLTDNHFDVFEVDLIKRTRQKVYEFHNNIVTSLPRIIDQKFITSDVLNNIMISKKNSKAEAVLMKGHKDLVTCLDSQNGQSLVSGSQDKKVKIWDLYRIKCLKTLSHHKDWIKDIHISRDGRLCGIASWDKTVSVYNLLKRKLILSELVHEKPVECVGIVQTEELIVSAAGSEIYVWDLASGRLVRKLNAHHDSINSLAVIAEDQIIITGSLDKTVKAWDSRTWECLTVLPLKYEVESLLSWGKEIVVNQKYGSFVIYNVLRNCEEIKNLNTVAYLGKVDDIKNLPGVEISCPYCSTNASAEVLPEALVNNVSIKNGYIKYKHNNVIQSNCGSCGNEYSIIMKNY